MDVALLFTSENFLIAGIAFMVSLLLAALVLHVSAKLLGLRRGYETAFGVTFLWLLLVFVLGIILAFFNTVLSVSVSAIVGLILWMFLVKKAYRTTFLLAFVTFIVMIFVQVLFYLLVAFVFWAIALL